MLCRRPTILIAACSSSPPTHRPVRRVLGITSSSSSTCRGRLLTTTTPEILLASSARSASSASRPTHRRQPHRRQAAGRHLPWLQASVLPCASVQQPPFGSRSMHQPSGVGPCTEPACRPQCSNPLSSRSMHRTLGSRSMYRTPVAGLSASICLCAATHLSSWPLCLCGRVAALDPSHRSSHDCVAHCLASLALHTACAYGTIGPFASLVT